jgi:cyclic pyranopterin phosphate synthase
MTPADIEQLVRHLVKRWGLTKVRLTGGEPTSRRDILEIVERISAIEGIKDLAMTTNGLTLPAQAMALKQAGLKRINISLDSLDPQTFERMTGVKGPKRVIEGIDAAIDAGLAPVRLNAVVLAGENDCQLPELVRFAADRKVTFRFIELMPMGPLADQWEHRFVNEQRMKEIIAPGVTQWQPLEQGHDAARCFRVRLSDGRWTTIGFITPMSCNFCAACNRVRITSAGDVYPCLMDQPRGNINAALYPFFDPDKLDELLQACLQHKAPEHPVNGFTQMTILGG